MYIDGPDFGKYELDICLDRQETSTGAVTFDLILGQASQVLRFPATEWPAVKAWVETFLRKLVDP